MAPAADFDGEWRAFAGRLSEGPTRAYALTKASTLTADYQFVTNPAYNADRGPVHIFSGRMHAEF